MAYAEPNALPARFDDWQEWREMYAERVQQFRNSPQHPSDALLLKIKLGQLGYAGVQLDQEIEFIKENQQ